MNRKSKTAEGEISHKEHKDDRKADEQAFRSSGFYVFFVAVFLPAEKATALRSTYRQRTLNVGLGLGQVHHAAALFPNAALFEQIDALETLENVALGCNGAGGTKAAVLGHKGIFG